MMIYKDKTFAGAYKLLLRDLISNPEYVCSPRDQKINEIMNVTIEIDPEWTLYSNERRSSQYRYIASELVWYFAGRKDADFIQKYAKFWKEITNIDGTLNSAYGYLIFTKKNNYGISQWQWAYESLKKDKDSRQAIIHFNTPDHQFFGNRDFVCTLYAVFHIRENKLALALSLRSNDAILGLPTDCAFFGILQQNMLILLKEHYPELLLGTYTHHVNSMHLYKRNFGVVKEMLDHDFVPERLYTDKPLVKKDGTMTEEMESIHVSVDSGIPDLGANWSPIFQWIHDRIFENIYLDKLNIK